MSVINRSRLINLVGGIQTTDPKLYEVLREIIIALEAQSNDVDALARLSEIEEIVTPPDIDGASYSFTKRNVILTWLPNEARFYEIRLGNDWDTANRLLVTGTNIAVFEPLPVGTTRYLLRSVNLGGVYSAGITILDVVVPELGTMIVSATVIDNNVLLIWNEPTSTFTISHYILDRNGTVVGNVSGTFIPYFEISGGTNTYGITAVDIAGNQSARFTVNATVNQPPDYELLSEIKDGFLLGSSLNAVTDTRLGPVLYVPVFPTETFEEHFTKGPWDSIQELIDDGYIAWLTPAQTTGNRIALFDFGVEHENVLVTTRFSSRIISGSVAVSVPTIEFSTVDMGGPWSGLQTGASVFRADPFRYVRVTYTFTPTDDKSLLEFFEHYVSISIQKEIDSGQILADKDDALGTIVTFNKAFRDVDSITLTVDSVEPLYAIYDFVDIPNPTTFKVLVYDSSGNRVDYLVSWKARGIV